MALLVAIRPSDPYEPQNMHQAAVSSRTGLACFLRPHTTRQNTRTVVPAISTGTCTAANRRQQLAATMSENYSIWIKPSGYMYNKLQQEIATQAKEYGAPLFEPHVTLLPDIQGDEEQIIATMQQLAQETKVGIFYCCYVFAGLT